MRRILLATALATAAIAAGVSACGASETGLPSGLLSAPMLAGGARSAASGFDGGNDAFASARRAMPQEPREPPGMSCRRNVSCREEEDEAPVVPLPSPYERCPPSSGKAESGFSAQETTAQRQWEPHTCCYVEFLDCKRSSRK